MRSTASRRAWSCCLVWLLALAPAHAQAQQQPVVERVSDGQQLADAVAAYGRRNADTTLLVPASTTLRLANATLPIVPDAEAAGGKAFSSGVLIIEASEGRGVIDAGMRAGLLPPQGISTRLLILRNMSVINTCAVVNVRGPGLTLPAVQTLLGLFSMASLFRSVRYENVSLYVRQGEANFLLYIVQSQRTPWPLVVERYRRQTETYPNLLPAVARSTAHTFTLTTIVAGAWEGADITCASTTNPDDPLVQSMRRDGTLLPLAWCANGSRVPADIADAPYDPLWGPLVSTDTAAEAVEAMRQQAAAAAQLEASQLPVPAVMVHAPRVDLSSRQPTIPLPAPLMLWGPFNDVPTRLLPVPVLDLDGNRTTPVFNLSGSGQVFITRLALSGLPSQPLPSVAPAVLPSALPLLSLAASFTSAAAQVRVHLHNVTLVVPQQDFLALLTLAMDGSAADGLSVRPCVDGAVLQLAAQLSGSISQVVLAPGQNLSGLWRAVQLSGYTGWGVNATQLVVRPQAAVPDSLTSTCVPAPSSSSSSDDDSSGSLSGGAIAGIVVGSVVGGALLLAAALLLLRRRRDSRHARELAHKVSLGASTDPGTSFGPPAKPDGAAPSVASHGTQASAAAAAAAGLMLGTRDTLSPSQSASAAVDGGAAGAPSLLSLLGQAERRLLARTDAAALEALAAGGPGSAAQAAPDPGAPPAGAVLPPSALLQPQAPPPTGASLLGQAHAWLMTNLRDGQGSSATAAKESGGTSGDAGGGATSGSGSKPPESSSTGSGSAKASTAGVDRGGGGASSSSHPLDRVKQLMGSNTTLYLAAKQVNRVVLHDVLGHGSSGTVYLGEWKGLPVAVKTVVYEARDGAEHAAAVMETAISASVGHRNVVATYHYDIKRVGDQAEERGSQAGDGLQVQYLAVSPAEQEEGAAPAVAAFKVFLIQELCHSSLLTVLARCGLHDPNCPPVTNQILALSILLHMATGLEYLHGLNLIHGDLTPANVLLKLDPSEPGGILAKLADFGLSRRLDAQATHVSNFAAGTPFYVAPEVVHYKRTSPASDIFSFGVIMWQSLTGLTPYVSNPSGGLMPNPAFPTLGPDVLAPPSIRTLMIQCLADDPRLRCTATQIRQTLGAHLNALLSAPPPPPPGLGSATLLNV